MDNPIFLLILSFCVLLSLTATVSLILVLRSLRFLRREQQETVAKLSSLENDVMGMAEAGVNIDRLILAQDKTLRECLERLESLHTEETQSHPYHAAIEKIKQGADAKVLVRDFGMSLSEAELLVRLHGTSH